MPIRYRHALVFAAAGLLCSCAMVSPKPPPGISSDGYTALTTWPLGPFHYSRVDTYLPGDARDRPAHDEVCAGTGHRIRITRFAADDGTPLDSLCALVDAAAAQAQTWFPGPRARYHILIAPEGTRVSRSQHSLRRASTPLPMLLAVRQYPDSARTRGMLVDLVSHESFHALGLAAGSAVGLDEQRAYRVALCAQLDINGAIPEATLPGAPVASDDAAVRASAGAAYTVRLETYPLLQEGVIRADGDGGRELQRRCTALRVSQP